MILVHQWRWRLLLAGFAAGAAVGSARRAEANRLPAPLRVTVLLKALTFDGALSKRTKGTLNVGVLWVAGDDEGASVGKEMLEQLQRAAGRRVAGLTLTSTALELARDANVGAALVRGGVHVVYLAAGAEHFAGPLSAVARERRVLLVSGEEEHARGIAGLTVLLRGDRPGIVVHLHQARAQGAEFDARLLRLAEVVK